MSLTEKPVQLSKCKKDAPAVTGLQRKTMLVNAKVKLASKCLFSKVNEVIF
jgi:hypothetical protein